MYVDKDGKEYPHIYLLMQEDNGLLPGWYFEDITQDMNGPFSTFEEVFSAFEEYCNWLCSGPGDTKE